MTKRIRIAARASALALAAVAALLVPVMSRPASAALAATGPTDPATGYPAWYQDANGLRLAPCVDASPPCITTRPDLTQAPAVPNNWPMADGEAFYFSADATIDRPALPGAKPALLVLATEGGFLPDAAPGNQVAFSRVRVRVDHLVPGATYTVTHPYGQKTFTIDGTGFLNDTVDVGCLAAPCDGFFDRAMAGAIGPFLQWDPAVAPAPPAGYIGSFGTPHTVVGSPLNTNFFRITGPSVGGIGINQIETNLFDVTGKLAPATDAALRPAAVAYGNIRVGSSAQQTVTLTNFGTAAITVTNAAVTGANPTDFGVVSDACTGTTVAVGGSCAIGVRFAPTTAGARAAALTVTDTAPNSPQTTALSGFGLAPAASLSPVRIDFGQQKVGTTSAERTITVTSSGSEPLVIDTVSIAGAAASNFTLTGTTCEATTLAPGRTCTAAVTFKPVAAGVRSASLVVTNNTPIGSTIAPLTGTGTAPATSFNPSSVSFGPQLILTSSATKQVKLTNTGNATLTIRGLALTGANAADFSIASNTCGASLAAGSSCFVLVRFTPLFIGFRSATLDLSSDAPSGNATTVPLSGQGSLLIL